MIIMNKVILITFLFFSSVYSYSQNNSYIVKRDTIFNRQIIEKRLYNSFTVEFDSLILIDDIFKDTLISLVRISLITPENEKIEIYYGPSSEKENLSLSYFFNGFIATENYNLTEYIEKDTLKRKDGIYRAYYPTKEIKERGYYQKDIKIGKWLYYYNNGEIQAKGEYSGDYFLIRNIKYTTELFVSKPSLDTLFKNEYPQDLQEFMDTIFNGNTKLVFPKIYHRKIGEWLYYDNLGHLIKKEYFKNNGLYRREYYFEEKIIKEENY